MKLLSTVRLTDNQKRVFAKIAAAPTPTVASEKISADANLISARNSLMKLGLITLSDDSAEITDTGYDVAQKNDVLDDSHQLTELGNKFAFTDSKNQPEKEESGSGTPPLGGDMGAMGGMGAPGGGLGGMDAGALGDEGGVDLGDPNAAGAAGADGAQPPNAQAGELPPEDEEDQQPTQMKAEGFLLLKELLA